MKTETTRSKLFGVVDCYATMTDQIPIKIYDRLYDELNVRHLFSAKARAEVSGQDPLDIIEREGFMEVLYLIACDILVTRPDGERG